MSAFAVAIGGKADMGYCTEILELERLLIYETVFYR